MTIAVVTDSTSYLPGELAAEHRIRVVPLRVQWGGQIGRDVLDIGSSEVAQVLRDPTARVTTSRPAPAEFAALYRELLDDGAQGVVSVHLSRLLSGTWEAARIAADEVDPGRVRVVDSRSAAMGLGFAAMAAARAASAGLTGALVEDAAADVAARSRVYFCVDSLEHLRRGGRIGAATAWVGSALAVKPLLHMTDGMIKPLEKVRTTARAMTRLVELAVRAAGESGDGAELAVHHLGAAARAEELRHRLAERLPGASSCVLSEVGAVLGAHAGPGLLGIVVVPPAR
ncbi:DegV family protein [Pseudonocardia spinosispora]|uniref:DegV family protein n=1 Tax=Pseudonocardia spinosispora TaxID=103441 RepID=UPI0003F53EE9|nr:DegV family protein [Pseudonocardia spinosispora]